MKTIDSKNIIKTLNWVVQTDGDDESVIKPKLNQNGLYECTVHLPVIEKTIIGIGESKLESIENATNETSRLIDEYLEENPDYELKTEFDPSKYIFEEDDKGTLRIHYFGDGAYC